MKIKVSSQVIKLRLQQYIEELEDQRKQSNNYWLRREINSNLLTAYELKKKLFN